MNLTDAFLILELVSSFLTLFNTVQIILQYYLDTLDPDV